MLDLTHTDYYQQGERDYAALPKTLPAWKGNLNRVGHGGTYGEPNGGLFAEAAANWMLWLYNGDAKAGAYFADGAGASAGWNDATSRNTESFSVPIGGAGAAAAPSTANATSSAAKEERDCDVQYVKV